MYQMAQWLGFYGTLSTQTAAVTCLK